MIKKYIRRCKNCFPVYGKEERQFLKRLRHQIEEYTQENQELTYQQLEEQFGTPIDIVKSYYDTLENENRLIDRACFSKYLRRIFAMILVILIVISLVIVKIRKEDFHIEINKLIQYLGGKDNIIDAQMNLSRLKVTVKDTTLVNKEGIQKLGAKGIVEIDNQLKILFGPNSKQLKKYMIDLK